METGTRCRTKDNLSGRVIRRNESKWKQRTAFSGQREGNIWSGGGIARCSHSPPSPAASLCHPKPILHPRRALARHHGLPTFLSACRKATTHPIWTALWQQHACHQVGQSEGGKPAAGCKPCMPTLPSPASRRPCGQWAAAPGRLAAGESLCWGDCTSITSPKLSSPLSNHQRRSNRRPHRLALDQRASGPLCTSSHSGASMSFPGPISSGTCISTSLRGPTARSLLEMRKCSGRSC